MARDPRTPLASSRWPPNSLSNTTTHRRSSSSEVGPTVCPSCPDTRACRGDARHAGVGADDVVGTVPGAITSDHGREGGDQRGHGRLPNRVLPSRAGRAVGDARPRLRLPHRGHQHRRRSVVCRGERADGSPSSDSTQPGMRSAPATEPTRPSDGQSAGGHERPRCSLGQPRRLLARPSRASTPSSIAEEPPPRAGTRCASSSAIALSDTTVDHVPESRAPHQIANHLNGDPEGSC